MTYEDKELALTTQVGSLSKRQREFVLTVFLEELSLSEVALPPEDHRQLSSILEQLKEISLADGIVWALAQLNAPQEVNSFREREVSHLSFQDDDV